MTRPFLTVVIATQGRDTLPRALRSIRDQAGMDAVEILVVADVHGEPLLSDVQSIASDFDAVYLEHDAGYHDSGHPQAQIGTEAATGRWLVYLGDDDVFEPGALAVVTRVIGDLDRPRPIMFRVLMHASPTRPIAHPIVLWRTPQLVRGTVTAQNIVCPNVPGLLGRWGDDFDFIASTVEAHGGPDSVLWRKERIGTCF